MKKYEVIKKMDSKIKIIDLFTYTTDVTEMMLR